MSAYTDQNSILGNIQMADLISLTDDDAQGVLNTTILNQVITNASATVDMYCANIYGQQLPFAAAPNTPQSVANMALTIACFQLYRRRLVPFEQNNYRDAYTEVIKMLEMVNTGDMHLNDVPVRDFPQVVYTARTNPIYGNVGSNYAANSM